MPERCNYSLKSEVLKNGAYNNYIDYRRSLYHLEHDIDVGVYSHGEALQEQQRINEQYVSGSDEFIECERLYNSNRARFKRLREKIERWIRIGCVYFITLTFSDSVFERSSALSRRRAVNRFLSSFDGYFVANIDFGEEKGREHYHCVLCLFSPLSGDFKKVRTKIHGRFTEIFVLNSPSFSFWEDTYGWYTLQPFSSVGDDDDIKRISHYVSKLSNHALKESAGTGRLLYSRKVPSWDQHFHDTCSVLKSDLESGFISQVEYRLELKKLRIGVKKFNEIYL